MIIYVCFIIFDGIVLSNSQPIKISMISSEPESPEPGITTNLNPSDRYVTSNLTETNSKSRRSNKFFISHQGHTKRSLSERSIKVDSSNDIETNSKFRRSERSLPSNHGHSIKHATGRSINVDSRDAVEAKSRIYKRSSLPRHGHARRSLPERPIKVDSRNTTETKSKRPPFRRSLPERSIEVLSRNTAETKSKKSSFRGSLPERSIEVDSRNVTDLKSRRSKRSSFHVHGRRGFSEHSKSGRSITKVEERRRAKDDEHGDKSERLKDGNGTLLQRSKRGSMFSRPYDGNILLIVQLFLLFIPLASASAVVLSPLSPLSDDDTSTWDGAAGDYARKSDKDVVADEFVLNKIKGADPLAKRLKLERVLGHQCPCLYNPTAPPEAKPANNSTRYRYYASLVLVVVFIAFLVYKIVEIVS